VEYRYTTGPLYGASKRRVAPRPDRIGCWDFFNSREHRLVAQKKTGHGTPCTNEDVRELKAHSRARTPLTVIAKKMKRTQGALRRKAGILGIGLGHSR
jgi:hypothetical protein